MLVHLICEILNKKSHDRQNQRSGIRQLCTIIKVLIGLRGGQNGRNIKGH